MGLQKLLCGAAFNYHDSSVSFALDNKVVLVLEAERVFRRKKMSCNSNEMEKLIQHGVTILNKTPDDISYWALSTLRNPWLEEKDKYPNPPVWRDVTILGKKRKTLVVNHHLSHATAFLFSPFPRAIIFSCDGGGDCGERNAIFNGEENRISKEDFDVSDFITAKPYDLCATYLYASPRCEGKLMALAAYGEPTDSFVKTLEDLLPVLCTTDYETGDRILTKAFPGLKGKASASNKDACNFSASLQDVFTRHRISAIEKLVGRYNPKNLVLVGGACLNLEVNTKIWKRFPQIATFIPSCCDDTGMSLGALVYLMAEIYGRRPEVKLPYLGFGEEQFDYSEKTIDEIVDKLIEDEVILLHNGQAEIGPRALGNRSFIARPDKAQIKKVVSEEIKSRENYRPLAPVVVEARVHEYYEGPTSSPFMLQQYAVIEDTRDLVVAGVHRNNTARVQTVIKSDNKFLYDLLRRFGERTGIYVLVNTSLNLRGDPISNTIEDTLAISRKISHPHTVVYNGEILR